VSCRILDGPGRPLIPEMIGELFIQSPFQHRLGHWLKSPSGPNSSSLSRSTRSINSSSTDSVKPPQVIPVVLACSDRGSRTA
jgi:hypothetical protein